MSVGAELVDEVGGDTQDDESRKPVKRMVGKDSWTVGGMGAD